MSKFKKLAVAGLAAATMAVTFMPTSAEAQWRRHHHYRGGGGGWNAGAGIAAGLIGGALLGAALSRPAYGAGYGYGTQVYSDPYYGGSYYGTPAYAAPAYAAPVYAAPAYRVRRAQPVYYAQPRVQCYRQHTGWTRSGRPAYAKVCYQG